MASVPFLITPLPLFLHTPLHPSTLHPIPPHTKKAAAGVIFNNRFVYVSMRRRINEVVNDSDKSVFVCVWLVFLYFLFEFLA